MTKIGKRIKYYWSRLTNMDFTGFKDALKHAQIRTGRSKFRIAVDMIISSFRYTAGYTDYNEYEFYMLNSRQRRTYLTLGQSHKVSFQYNDKILIGQFDDKSIFNKKFAKYVSRGFLDIRDSDAKGLEDFIKRYGKVMAKKVDDYVGRGIDKIDLRETPDLNFSELYDTMTENRQFLVEEFFTQHDTMNLLSDRSVNTIRMITFVDNNKVPHLIVAALKSGLGSHVDNFGQGGMYTILDDKGKVMVPFIDSSSLLHIRLMERYLC